MTKYIAIIGSALAAVAAVVAFFLTLDDAYGYTRSGVPFQLPAGCGVHVRDAVQSVHAGVPVNAVQKWHCSRTLLDEAAPLEANCWGVYETTLTGVQWWTNVSNNGFGKWRPVEIDRDAGTVTVRRQTATVRLNAAQKAAHIALFDNACIRDHDNAALEWGDVVNFTVYRWQDVNAMPPVNIVMVRADYATSESDPLDIAEAVKNGEALWPLAEAE